MSEAVKCEVDCVMCPKRDRVSRMLAKLRKADAMPVCEGPVILQRAIVVTETQMPGEPAPEGKVVSTSSPMYGKDRPTRHNLIEYEPPETICGRKPPELAEGEVAYAPVDGDVVYLGADGQRHAIILGGDPRTVREVIGAWAFSAAD